MAAISLSSLIFFVLHALFLSQCTGEAFSPTRPNNVLDVQVRRSDNANMGDGYWDAMKASTTMAPLIDHPGIAARAARLFKRACSFTGVDRVAGQCGDLCCTNGVFGWCCNAARICGDGVNGGYCGFFATVTSTVIVTATTNVAVTTTEARSSPGSTIISTSTSTTVITTTRSDLQTATEIRTIIVTVDPRKRDLARIPGPTQAPSLPTPSMKAVQKKHQHPLAVTDVSPNPTAHPRFLKRQAKSTRTDTTTLTAYITQIRRLTVTSLSIYAVTSTTETVVTLTSTVAVNAKITITSTTTSTATRGVTPAGGPASPNPNPSPSPSPSPSSSPIDGSGGAGTGGASDKGSKTDNDKASSGLSTGAKAGIGTGAALGALLLGLLAAFLIRRRRRQRKAEIAKEVNAAVLKATGGQATMSSPKMTEKEVSHTPQLYPHSNGTMSPQPQGSELEGSHHHPQSWNVSQGYEMAGTHSPVMGHAQPYSPAMQHSQPATGYAGQGGYAAPHYAGQTQMHEMYTDPAGRR